MNHTHNNATKRPWQVVTNGNPDFRGISNSTGKWALATLSWPAGIEQAEWEANAALIVQAVNEYDALCAVARVADDALQFLRGNLQAAIDSFSRYLPTDFVNK